MFACTLYSSEKRDRRAPLADFGFGRGFSGKLEAQHRYGQDFALNPFGPGKRSIEQLRRRRDVEKQMTENVPAQEFKVMSSAPSLLRAGQAEAQRRLAQEFAANPAGPGK